MAVVKLKANVTNSIDKTSISIREFLSGCTYVLCEYCLRMPRNHDSLFFSYTSLFKWSYGSNDYSIPCYNPDVYWTTPVGNSYLTNVFIVCIHSMLLYMSTPRIWFQRCALLWLLVSYVIRMTNNWHIDDAGSVCKCCWVYMGIYIGNGQAKGRTWKY